ncbi:4-alpha-glucanotransferase [Solihabitans fulvus]|uniref:4-alpha-glucanotransferase n=1 Tax=Solihabitans fulvus TaxID=1892852 RepID=UPI001CB766BA|nr:4-alpha-glucanotransferase [Solihabitans fulvus]
MDRVDEQLAELAARHGVATSYEGADQLEVDVDRAVVVAVLAQLGVDAGTPADVRRELGATRDRRALPGTVVTRAGRPARLPGPAVVRCADGTERAVAGLLPADLPLGWHRLTTADQDVALIVAPDRLPRPAPAWGWMLQLYALRSRESWGMGDFGDLATIAARSRSDLGAGVVLVNPVQAIAPTTPVQRSPYSPASRRFANPLYLRITDTDAFAEADPATRSRVLALRPPGDTELIDHDGVWLAKRAALEALWADRPRAVDVDADPALRDFATFCAIADRHGPDWRTWPEALRHPAGPAVAAARRELAQAVAFHAWLQRLCADQLGAARRAAAGMAVGIVHDLPVGVDPGGADAWALQDVFASRVRVGAPPDAFSQQGQDWNLPPWRPDRLADAGHGPFRDVLRAVLGHADGIRIDHVAGLWRLWWIPPGEPPSRGTYVRYDAEAMLGVLALEAHRAGAVVVGEDLGTVEPAVTTTLHERGMLSSAVLWFQRDYDVAGHPMVPPQQWTESAMASISTHDLPTVAGFLRGEHVRVRASLGMLTRPVEREEADAAAELRGIVDLLAAEGLVGPDPDERELIVALHALLARAPSRLLLTSPQDALGDPRQPNLPGTVDQYPNWRLPLAVRLEEFLAADRVAEAVAALRAARPSPS